MSICGHVFFFFLNFFFGTAVPVTGLRLSVMENAPMGRERREQIRTFRSGPGRRSGTGPRFQDPFDKAREPRPLDRRFEPVFKASKNVIELVLEGHVCNILSIDK